MSLHQVYQPMYHVYFVGCACMIYAHYDIQLDLIAMMYISGQVCKLLSSSSCDFLNPPWWRHYATSRKASGSNPDEISGFFNWPNPSSYSMVLGSTQPLIEMSTRNLSGGKERPVRKADNLTAICEPIV
jgi:hypothetical protein